MYNLLLVVLSDTLQRLLLKNYSYGWHRFYQSNILAQYLYFFLNFGYFWQHSSHPPQLHTRAEFMQDSFTKLIWMFWLFLHQPENIVHAGHLIQMILKKNILRTLHTVMLITLSDVHLWKFLSAFYCLWCSQHFLKKWPQITQKLLRVTSKK